MSAFTRRFAAPALVAFATFAAGCGDDDGGTGGAGESEVISRVTLTLAPAGGGTAQTAIINFSTPTTPEPQEGSLVLQPGVTYAGTVQFTNAFASPPVDITAEVEAEADEHRVFYTVTGPSGVTIPESSLDVDPNGVPLGLAYDVVVASDATPGDGSIRVILSHYDDQPKGDGSTPGPETDVDVVFAYTVP